MDSAALSSRSLLLIPRALALSTYRAHLPCNTTSGLYRLAQLRPSMGQHTSRVTTSAAAGSEPPSTAGVVPSKVELKQRLSAEQYYVTQEKGTERAFSGKYWNEKKAGVYHCVVCDTPLFESGTKFDSGTGWPSYWDKMGSNVREESDWSIPFMPRTEVLCNTCGGHLGHVFRDGPRPTGLRYCINSASLRLQPEQSS